MYPLNLFALFPPFPRNNQVFVAMSFGDRFEPRWRDVIAPAIREVKVDGGRLVPYRVDANQVSDSVLTDILKNIAESRLVLADITTIGRLRRVPVRNGNVMYELGLAHATGKPVVLLCEYRSGTADLPEMPYDLRNESVIGYRREDTDGLREAISAILSHLKGA